MSAPSLARTTLFAALLTGMFAGVGSAASYSYTGAGGALVDGATDAGAALFDINVSGTGATVTSIQSVTLTGFSHTFAGDLGVYLIGPDGTTYSTLVAPPDDDGANFGGNYTFVVDATKSTIDGATVGAATTFNIPSGTYAISDYGDGVNPGPRSDFSALAGQPLDGTWTLEIDDFYAGETGTLGSWGFTANAGVAPEPTSIAALGAAGLLLHRRR